MAERRMMTRKVTDDDHFMALSSSAQALYLHLMMSADDDGFNNQVTIAMFRAHASVQDLEALMTARYVYQFEDGVIVIRHWRMANALRKDRYTPTAFQRELAQLKVDDRGVYQQVVAERLPDGCQMVAERLPQDSIGKDSIGQDSKGKGARRFAPPSLEEVKAYTSEKHLNIDAEAFVDFYESKGWRVGNQTMKDWRAAVRNWARRDAERKTTTTQAGSARKTSFHNFEERPTAGGSWDELETLADSMTRTGGGQSEEDTKANEDWQEMLEKWRSKRGKKD